MSEKDVHGEWKKYMQTIIVSARVVGKDFVLYNQRFTEGDYDVRFLSGNRLCVPREQFEFYYKEVKEL